MKIDDETKKLIRRISEVGGLLPERPLWDAERGVWRAIRITQTTGENDVKGKHDRC